MTERYAIDCPVCGKPAWWSPVYPWYDCKYSNDHPPQKCVIPVEPYSYNNYWQYQGDSDD